MSNTISRKSLEKKVKRIYLITTSTAVRQSSTAPSTGTSIGSIIRTSFTCGQQIILSRTAAFTQNIKKYSSIYTNAGISPTESW